ncbi:hypothetical protein NEIRO03_2567 [Nematocida sp. AWRm78]|nr:hypothetical protein NEIRO03_2567 [Nematocida sp. AWRm78]
MLREITQKPEKTNSKTQNNHKQNKRDCYTKTEQLPDEIVQNSTECNKSTVDISITENLNSLENNPNEPHSSDITRNNPKIYKAMYTMFYIILFLVGIINLLLSAPVSLIEVFNDKLQIGKYLLNIPECNGLPEMEMIHCIKNKKITEFPEIAIDRFLSSRLFHESQTPESFEHNLRVLNTLGMILISTGRILGNIFYLCLNNYFPTTTNNLTVIFMQIFTFTTIPMLFIHGSMINEYLPDLYTQSIISLITKVFLGINISLGGILLDLGLIRMTKINLGLIRVDKEYLMNAYSAVRIVSGCLGFLFPVVFSYIYYNLNPELGIFIISVLVFMPLITVYCLKKALNKIEYNALHGMNNETITDTNGQEESTELIMQNIPVNLGSVRESIEMEELENTHGNTIQSVRNNNSNENISKREITRNTLQKILYSLQKLLEYFPIITLVFPISFFMTGINIFIFYKESIIASTLGIFPFIVLSAPLVGGLLALFLPLRIKQSIKIFIGFTIIGICQLLFFIIKTNDLLSEDVLSKYLIISVSLILIVIVYLLNPLLGILPVLINPSGNFIAIYGLYQQIMDIIIFFILSKIFQSIGKDFILVCGIFSILSGIGLKIIIPNEL